MLRTAARGIASLTVKVAVALILVALADRVWTRDVGRPPVVRPARPTSVVVSFETGDVSLEAVGALPLDGIAARAVASRSARILVVGYANDRDAIQENLELA